MHPIRQQYTYNHALYARARDASIPGGRTLYSGAGITITDHDAPARGSSCTLDAISAGHRLIVTWRGAALVRRRCERGRALAAEPLQAIVLAAGVAYDLEPALDAVHCGTVFTYAPERTLSIVPPSADTLAADEPIAPHAPLDSRVLITFHRLRRRVAAVTAGAEHSTADVEEDALALLREVCDGHRARRRSASDHIMTRHPLAGGRRGNIVELVKCILATSPDAAHPLDELSGRLGISTSQLAHVFREETGHSPHRYLLHLRAALALGALSAGGGDLSRLALELGFATHSHFSAAFRRCTGMPPSEARLALAACGRSTRSPAAWITPLVRCEYV